MLQYRLDPQLFGASKCLVAGWYRSLAHSNNVLQGCIPRQHNHWWLGIEAILQPVLELHKSSDSALFEQRVFDLTPIDRLRPIL